MSDVFLSLDGLNKTFEGSPAPAVSEVSFSMPKGEILALLGPSGCGKTTTLRLIAGFESPDRGTISIGGRIVQSGDVEFPPEERGVGFVFQDYALFPHLDTRRNVEFGLSRLTLDDRRRRTREAMDLCGLEGMESRFPHELSGGQQQRTALARALAPGYELLLLDEPLSNLDAALRTSLCKELRRILKHAGRAAIVVTHDREEAFQIADRVAVMRNGGLEQVGSARELHDRPVSRFVAEFVLDATFLAGVVARQGVVTEIGPIPGADSLAAGTKVVVAVRPQQLELTPSPDGAGVVVERVFRGSHERYRVRLPSGTELSSFRTIRTDASSLDVGAPVALKLTDPAPPIFVE
ncbi:MAG: ABC transporter ATP-binding protein [Gammaproteobacteria bacterium]|nr:ABC transporter ATP-binding protein [Gammaproteobacteria bacterium]